MRGDHACAHSGANDGAYATADRGSYDRSAARSHAQLGNRALAMLVCHDIAFAFGLGVGADRVDDLSVQMVAGPVRKNKFVRAEMEDRSTVQVIACSGVDHPAMQFGTNRNHDFAVAQDVLRELCPERRTRIAGGGVDILQYANAE